VRYAAYTGKAALVMKTKGCHNAQTIHSLIYNLDEDMERYGDELRFVINNASPVANAALVIVDEVSMVGEALAKDLLSFGTPVLVLGDQFQLPPVNVEGYFTEHKPDVMLTEIHRQALENPIIKMSMDVREGRGLQLGTYGDSKVINARDVNVGMAKNADQILVGKHVTRKAKNATMRNVLGYKGTLPVAGDRLVCLKNNKDKMFLNGAMWRVDTAQDSDTPGHQFMELTPIDAGTNKNQEAKVHNWFFEGRENDIDRWIKRDCDHFDYGYAITVHKSQGSQWDDVLLYDESSVFREDAARHLYTGITRAAERITVAR